MPVQLQYTNEDYLNLLIMENVINLLQISNISRNTNTFKQIIPINVRIDDLQLLNTFRIYLFLDAWFFLLTEGPVLRMQF